MYLKRRLAMAIILLLGCHAAFAFQGNASSQSSDDSEWAESACDNGTGIDMMQCHKNIYDHLDLRLNGLYSQKMATLGSESKAALRESQRAWIVYRDKTCNYESVGGEGSYWGSIYLECMSRVTRQRIADLNEYLACRADGGCPH
jgi:uncharacterized protein YecT (DUF1311 family)